MSHQKSKHTGTYFFLTFSMICWGLSFIWYKQALTFFMPVSLVLLRLLISIPILLTLSSALKKLQKIRKKDFKFFLALAFFEPFLYFMSESYGMQYVSTTVAAVIISTIPLFNSLATFIFLREKLSANNYFGMVISFGGVLAVIYSDIDSFSATGLGIALIFISVFAAIAYGLIVNKIAANYSTLTIVSIQNIIASIFFIPVFIAFDLKEFNFSELTIDKLLPVLYMSVFASTIAYVGFIKGLRTLGVAKATVFTNFVPVFTAIFAFLILKEPVSFIKACGIILVISGLILSQSSKQLLKKKAGNIIVDELY